MRYDIKVEALWKHLHEHASHSKVTNSDLPVSYDCWITPTHICRQQHIMNVLPEVGPSWDGAMLHTEGAGLT